MDLRVVSLLVFSVLSECLPHPLTRPKNGLRECRRNKTMAAMEVLPGGGWDNLRNMDMGRVMNLSYSQCQTTEDGVFLIPDEVFVIPQKLSGVETNSEMITSWLEQRSSTSFSINSDVSFLSLLNAKFSVENQRVKTHQVRDSSVTTRVQVRNFVYTVKAYPDFTLDSRFVQQAEEIADALENNQTRQATYLSEKLVFDYGTHVITSVDAGAALVQEDYLYASFVSDSNTAKTSLSATAGLNFFNKVQFDIGSHDSLETAETRSYQGNITYSITQSHGGAPFYPGITLKKWQDSTLNNLVAIDRAGLPIDYFLNQDTFPELPKPTIRKLALSVRKAVLKYYQMNSRPGCVKPDSKNFNFQANVDDNSCEGPATNLSFGGVFQECTKLSPDADPICEALDQKNPETGTHSCRPPYTPTLLRSEIRHEPYNSYECHNECHRCWLIATCCKQVCGNVYRVRSALIKTYWCSASGDVQQFSGYLFGGLYSPSLINPLTKTKSCPANFFPMKLLSNGLMICLSNDYETATRFSVPFGGLFSCESGNPMAMNQSRCPPQFSQHLAAISDGCQVLYCVQSGLFTGGQLQPVHLPPFTRPPVMSMIATNTVAVMTEGDQAWVRVTGTKMWKLAKPGEVQSMTRMFDPSADQLSQGQKVGVAFGVIVLVALVICGTVVLVKWRRGAFGFRVGQGYEQIPNEGATESGVESQVEQGGSETPSQSPTPAILP